MGFEGLYLTLEHTVAYVNEEEVEHVYFINCRSGTIRAH